VRNNPLKKVYICQVHKVERILCEL
jgi:hypothetical protein